MKILVTGGAGFIGSHICEHARAAGHEVLALDDLSNGKRQNVPAGVELVVADIRDASALDGVFQRFGPDAVSHQAAQASVSVSVREPALDVAINVDGSINVLDACARHGVGRCVFASTGGAIYGEVPPGERAAVGWTPHPETPYAASKLAVEGYLRFFRSRGVQATSLRYANVYGPRQDPHGEAGVVAIFIQRLLAGRGVQVNAQVEVGDDGCVRDYVYVDDVARINLRTLEGGLDLDLINVGTGRPSTTRALLNAIVDQLGPYLTSRPGVADTPHRDGDVAYSVLDVDPFIERFGDPVPLAEGIRRTVAAFAPPSPGASS